jgi:Flp pilus assembly protein TadD
VCSSDLEGVHTATVALLAALQPESLPAGLSAEGQQRVRQIAERVREAGRVLADSGRRGIYDAQLARDGSLSLSRVGSEDQAELQAERARHHMRRGSFVTAAALFGKALQLGGGQDAEILAALGWARHCACPEDALLGEPEVRKALALDPQNEYSLCYLGRLLIERGKREQGRDLLRQALSQNHAFQEARDALRASDGQGQRLDGQTGEAG